MAAAKESEFFTGTFLIRFLFQQFIQRCVRIARYDEPGTAVALFMLPLCFLGIIDQHHTDFGWDSGCPRAGIEPGSPEWARGCNFDGFSCLAP